MIGKVQIVETEPGRILAYSLGQGRITINGYALQIFLMASQKGRPGFSRSTGIGTGVKMNRGFAWLSINFFPELNPALYPDCPEKFLDSVLLPE